MTVEASTPNPVDICSRAAGTCYGKDDSSEKRLRRCMVDRHMGVFEHATVTLRVEGISRACSHQLVRHRLMSFNQVSQRYCKMGEDYDFVTPPSVEAAGFGAVCNWVFQECMMVYRNMLEDGVPAEDARYILPQGGETEIVVTANLREWMHFWDLRCDKHAQWEIRELAEATVEAVRGIGEEYAAIVAMWEEGR